MSVELLVAGATGLADVGEYSVTVANPFLSVTRRASLIVNVPTVAMPVASQSVCLGSGVSFSTAVAGTGPHAFTWTKDGVTIPGANTRTLMLPATSATSAGTHCVIVQGRLNAVTDCATLTVTAGKSVVPVADRLEGPWRDAPELEPGGPIPGSDAPARFYRVQRRSLSK